MKKIVRFYKAECGDAFRIRYKGNDNRFHNVFIDSGFNKTFRFILAEEINAIIAEDERIDLWIISHIHDDHIGGVLKYLSLVNDREFPDLVDNWYYNSPRFYDEEIKANDNRNPFSNPISITQGDALYSYILINDKFSKTEITTNLNRQDFFGLGITILSPTIENLNSLQEKYSINMTRQFERIENDSISNAISNVTSDYHRKLMSFDLNNWKEDTSIENRSSISFITELNGKKILWLSDSLSTDIIKQLLINGYSENNKLDCEYVKVSHHGSSANSSSVLFNLINCSNYVFSANGENNYCLPNKECFAMILRANKRDISIKYHFYILYDNITTRRIFDNEDTKIFTDLNFEVHYLSHQKYLEVELG